MATKTIARPLRLRLVRKDARVKAEILLATLKGIWLERRSKQNGNGPEGRLLRSMQLP
jgi:hypothetical protein